MLFQVVFWVTVIIQANNVSFQLVSEYKIDISHITRCPEYENTQLPSPLEAEYVKYNKSVKVFNGNFTLSRDLDEKFFLHLIVRKWSEGSWKDDLIDVKFGDACNTFKKYTNTFWINFLRAGGVEHPEKCPIKKVQHCK